MAKARNVQQINNDFMNKVAVCYLFASWQHQVQGLCTIGVVIFFIKIFVLFIQLEFFFLFKERCIGSVLVTDWL